MYSKLSAVLECDCNCVPQRDDSTLVSASIKSVFGVCNKDAHGS